MFWGHIIFIDCNISFSFNFTNYPLPLYCLKGLSRDLNTLVLT